MASLCLRVSAYNKYIEKAEPRISHLRNFTFGYLRKLCFEEREWFASLRTICLDPHIEYHLVCDY